MLRRLPIESTQPVVAFALARVALTLVALGVVLVTGLPYEGRLAGVLAAVAVPWSAVALVLAQRWPDAASNPLVAAGDFAVLVALEVVVPESYGAVRFAAMFLIACHAHFQGEWRGVAIAVLGSAALIVSAATDDDAPIRGSLLTFYESVFGTAAVVSALLVGRLRTVESASRLRARGLTRRTIDSERQVRRRVAESIHDGPVQELIALDMVLSAAGGAADQGDATRAGELIGEAREITERNVRVLRDEIVDLGPYAFEELSYDVAVANCAETWRRRYGIEVALALEPLELPPETAADLFHITQEAVVNAGRHADADTVSLSLRTLDGQLELRIADDGQGFGQTDPLGSAEPGHLGLASIRERTELLGGELEIESSERGTRLLVRAPLPRRRTGRRGRPR